jgi:hypothetical protein
MPDWLQTAFEENSVLWLLVSSLLGGVIGASLRLVFEVILPQRIQQQREALAVERKYRVPILLAAEELRNRLGNIIRNINAIEQEGWLQHNPPGYYYLTTLYVVAQFFGWFRILRRRVTYLDLASTQETRLFEGYLKLIETGFSDPGLLRAASTGLVRTARDQWVFSFWLQAIGDQMIDEHAGEFSTLGYEAFGKRLVAGGQLSIEWFDALGALFRELRKDDPRFRRLVAIHMILNAFVEHLDPGHLRTKKSTDFSGQLAGEEVQHIEQIIRETVAA